MAMPINGYLQIRGYADIIATRQRQILQILQLGHDFDGARTEGRTVGQI